MDFFLNEFNIVNLHGDMDVAIRIYDNKLVIVAENGYSKTTIVNIIYYTLSGQWYKLTEYQFNKIYFTLNGKQFEVTRDELAQYFRLRKMRNRNITRQHNLRMTSVAEYIMTHYDPLQLSQNPSDLQKLSTRFDVPTPYILDILEDLIATTKSGRNAESLEKLTSELNKELNTQILYLPTYRRIEKDLKNIFPDLETNLDSLRSKRQNESGRKFIELVEFGMEDVEMKIDQRLNSLYLNFSNNVRQSLMGGYLKDIINRSYDQYSYSFLQSITTEKLSEILNRIDNSIIQPKEKDSITYFVQNYQSNSFPMNNENKIIAYFIQKLVEIYEQQSLQEKDVISFVDICNEYCRNKTFYYSREDRKIKIHLSSNGKEIPLSKLSSGEKQIVSLFSHLYLSNQKNFFVIIDEPELSLSVDWQERFLPDIINAYNVGIIAVTHSPYIFSNKLQPYTKGLNEFIILNDN